MVQRFLSGDDEIIVIDPMNEYFDIADTYGGTVVNMSTYTDNYVNPLEMDVWSLDPNDSKGMVREKGEFMLGLCEQCIGDSLNSRQNSIKTQGDEKELTLFTCSQKGTMRFVVRCIYKEAVMGE